MAVGAHVRKHLDQRKEASRSRVRLARREPPQKAETPAQVFRHLLSDALEVALNGGMLGLPAWKVERELRHQWRWLVRNFDVQRPDGEQ
jgi:hypothetical protein